MDLAEIMKKSKKLFKKAGIYLSVLKRKVMTTVDGEIVTVVSFVTNFVLAKDGYATKRGRIIAKD